ncbi:unnamed protein product, partial [Meganyctiphanes norvegica]
MFQCLVRSSSACSHLEKFTWIYLFFPYLSLPSIAFTSLMVPSCLIFTEDGLASGALHKTKLFLHWLLLGLAFVIAGAGFFVIYYNKELNDKPHFISWHGIIGLLACICLAIQVSFGIISKYPLYLKRFIGFKLIRATHAIFGVNTLILGMIAIILGFLSDWYYKNGSKWVMYSAIMLHILLIYRVAYIVIQKYVRKIY